ncbi:MAG: amino acid permease [Sulfurovaceae bacterium]|nr:amino acid permease [Sulfurovaceae bacterium]
MNDLMGKMLRRKEYHANESKFEKKLGALALVMLGVGGTIGSGIFVLTGTTAATVAGPAIVLSFIFAAIAVGMSALVYAELGSNIPISGGAYSYTYTSIGEFAAWIVGWNLILEYGLIVPAVSTGWAGYFRGFIENTFGFSFPVAITGSFNLAKGTVVDLFALLMTAAIFMLLTLGIKKSANTNTVIVSIKLAVLALFIFVGIKYVDFNNLSNFTPFGWSGVWAATSLMVFAYLGFDALATVAEETKDVQKNLPIGLIGSLALSTALYLVVSFVLVSIVPYHKLDVPDALASAMYQLGEPFIGSIIAIGAIITLTSVLIVMGIGLTRVVYALSRDGLLPHGLATLHPKTNTPYKVTIITGVIATFVAGFVPFKVLAELINIGTLFAYFMIGVAVIVIRKKNNNQLNKGFKIPYGKVLLPLNLILLGIVMLGFSAETWFRFVLWSLIGALIYFYYGMKNSVLNKEENQ